VGNKRGLVPMLCGFAVMLCASAAGSLRAQAPPGPLAPKQPVDTQPATPTAQRPRQMQAPTPQEKPAPRQSIAGFWALNRDASDDARSKIEQAQRDGGRTRQTGPIGGNGPYGGGPLGRGYPFPGSNGPYGGGQSGGGPRNGNGGGYGGDDELQSPAMREYLYPASGVTLALKDAEVDLSDDAAHRRVFYTDGRKLQKSKDDNYREIAAHWEGSRLVSEQKLPGESLRQTFELAVDGRQLDEYVNLDATRSRSAVTVHYVYDINPNRQ